MDKIAQAKAIFVVLMIFVILVFAILYPYACPSGC